MANNKLTKEKAIEMIAEILISSAEEILKDIEENPKITLDNLGLDELDQIELIMDIQKEFNISIPYEDIPDCYGSDFTIDKLVEITNKQIR